MQIETLPCVGGPADGKMVAITKGVKYLRIPVLPPVQWTDESEPLPEAYFREVIYTRQKLHDGLKTHYVLFAPDGDETLIEHLLIKHVKAWEPEG